MAFIVYGLNTPIKRKIVKLVLVMIHTEIIFEYIDKLKMKGWVKIDKANTNHKKAILTAGKVGSKKMSITSDTKEEHLTMINYFPQSQNSCEDVEKLCNASNQMDIAEYYLK